MIDPLAVYIEARDRHGLTNSAVARFATNGGFPLNSHSLDLWEQKGTGRVAWQTVVQSLRVVGVNVDFKPDPDYVAPVVRPAGRPKRTQ